MLDYVPTHSAAAAAGLRSGDTILSLNNRKMENWQALIEQASVGLRQAVPVVYMRDGRQITSSMNLPQVADDSAFAEAVGLIPKEQTVPLRVHDGRADMPAALAGLRAGDQILSVDGQTFHSVPPLANYLTDHDGKPSSVLVSRNGTSLPLTITPHLAGTIGGRKQFQFGFTAEPVPFTIEHLSFGAAMAESWKDNLRHSQLVAQILRGLFTHQVSMKSMSGPVGIEQQVAETAKEGFWPVAELSAMISLQLGIFNLLPMPILDGGLILFLLIESAARRDVNPVVKEKVYQAAFVCILLFFAFVMWNDISRLSWFAHRPS